MGMLAELLSEEIREESALDVPDEVSPAMLVEFDDRPE
jgi:hypothetical protein